MKKSANEIRNKKVFFMKIQADRAVIIPGKTGF
jgi:hypothetical protein